MVCYRGTIGGMDEVERLGRQAAKALQDIYDMLHGYGRHEGHTREQVGRCVYCSCGLRVQGYLAKREGTT